MRRRWIVAVLVAASCAARTACATPSFTTFGTLASFQAALGGAATLTQDFEGFAPNADLSMTAILPGVTAASTGALTVFASASVSKIMFGSPRTGPEFHYDVNLSTPYNAIAFDIQAFDPRAEPGRLDVHFADATSTSFDIGPGATETTPVFFGIVANGPISSIRWNESLEPLTHKCCEETGLDNFVVATTAVPEPSSFALMGVGLAGLLGVARSRRRQKNAKWH